MKFHAWALGLLLPLCSFGHGIVTNTDQQTFQAMLEGGGHVQIATTSPIVLTQTIHIAADTAIEGISPNAVVSGGNNFRIFTVAEGVTLTLNRVKLVHSRSSGNGGAISITNGTLRILNSIMSSNTSVNGGAISIIGGSIFIENSFFSFNKADSEGGVIVASNSVIRAEASIFEKNEASTQGAVVTAKGTTQSEFWNCHVHNNTAPDPSTVLYFVPDKFSGGAFKSDANTTLTFSDCSFIGNRNAAIYNAGALTIRRCNFESNLNKSPFVAYLFGPRPTYNFGSYGGAINNQGEAVIEDCLFLSNSAVGGDYGFKLEIVPDHGTARGGAIYQQAGICSISRSTFVSNSLHSSILGDVHPPPMGGYSVFAEAGELRLDGNIFSGAQAVETNQYSTAIITTVNSNLFSHAGFAGNLQNTNPQLGQPGFYGGYTRTIPLLEDSPAIDLGPIAATNSLDQRHAIRHAGTRTDAGSFEYGASPSEEIPIRHVILQTRSSTGVTTTSTTNVPSGFVLLLSPLVPNQSFARWEGAITSFNYPLHYVVTQDVTLTAVYTQLFSVTHSVSPENPPSGYVTTSQISGLAGDQVIITASATNRGSRFVRWTGTYNNTNNPLTFTLEADTQLTAIFEQAPSYTVTANSSGSGTVNPSSTNVFEGETLTLQATPSPNNRFTGWTGSFSSTQNPLVITVTSNINLTANFQPTLFRLHFHDNTGLFAHWEGTLAEITHSQLDWPLGEPNRMPTYWQLASAADRFKRWDNGEAYLDLIWRGAQGDVAYWQVNNKSLQMASGQTISGPANLGAWILAGGPYFDSANAFGLLWLHPPTGHLGTWFGTNQQAQVFLPPNSGWELIKTRDFDSDGDADLLWQHNPTGTVALWKGTQLLTSLHSNLASQGSLLTSAVPGWRVVDLVDLNADGHLDLLWQSKTTGAVAVWLLNNLQLPTLSGDNAFIIPKNGPASYHNPGPQWRIFAVKTSY